MITSTWVTHIHMTECVLFCLDELQPSCPSQHVILDTIVPKRGRHFGSATQSVRSSVNQEASASVRARAVRLCRLGSTSDNIRRRRGVLCVPDCAETGRFLKTVRSCHSHMQSSLTQQTLLLSLTYSHCRVQRMPWQPVSQWEDNVLYPEATGASVLGGWGGFGGLWPVKVLPKEEEKRGRVSKARLPSAVDSIDPWWGLAYGCGRSSLTAPELNDSLAAFWISEGPWPREIAGL